MTTPKTVRAGLTRLAERCSAAGVAVTPQRRTIVAVLAGRDDHPTVDQIYSAVVERMPEVSRTTVYRSLEVLTELGVLQRVEHSGSAVRFDANMAPHHHFLCRGCGSLADLPLDAVAGHEALEFVGDPELTADDVALIVRGTCAACRA